MRNDRASVAGVSLEPGLEPGCLSPGLGLFLPREGEGHVPSEQARVPLLGHG